MNTHYGYRSRIGRAARVGTLLTLGLAACAEDGGRMSSDGGGIHGLPEGSSTGAGEDELEEDTDLNVDDDGSGGLPGADDGGSAEGCKRVDFLFVVDNSVSMENEQAALTAAFPGFMDAISSTLQAGSDYHVMVLDTDDWGRCDTANGWEGSSPDHETCDEYIQTTVFAQCDRVRGAGVVHPAGALASNEPCEPHGGNRYIVEGEPDLAGTFACMATVGTAGHPSERPMDSLVAALDPALNGPGGCNDGFLRDDALLVVTFISDDPHWEDTGEPEDWYQAVVDAKHGDPSAVVMLGITPAWEDCRQSSPEPKGSHWAEFVSMWGDTGLHGNVCGTADDYVSFFQDAVATIDQACDEYIPPG